MNKWLIYLLFLLIPEIISSAPSTNVFTEIDAVPMYFSPSTGRMWPYNEDGTTNNFDNVSINFWRWTINGLLPASGGGFDGNRFARSKGKIVAIIMDLDEKGNNGSTIVDINKSSLTPPFTNQQTTTIGLTIYTNQVNRPTLVGDNASKSSNAVIEALVPDIENFVAGDVFTVELDQRTPLSRTLSITIFFREQ